ncbi:hypothetical protein [Streptomyces sp. NPDC021212]|uniref:hypothetical protein n=1 Tax=Streptomyces sp. NPDC021212 TaxID=3365118 RepID=UPI0037BC90F5
MKRRWSTAMAVMVMATGVAGCSGGDGEKDADRACDKGSYEWFNVSQQSVLTDVGRTRHYDKGEKASSRRVRESPATPGPSVRRGAGSRSGG